jgi:predicted RNase H-like HicB family nuclease
VIVEGVLQFNFFGTLKRQGEWYIAHCPPLDLTTQGRTPAEARRNLAEAAELFLISCLERGTLDQALRELGFTQVRKSVARRPENAFPMVIPVPLRFQRNPQCHA